MSAVASVMTGSSKEYPAGRALDVSRHAMMLATGAALPEEIVTNENLIGELDLVASDRAVQFSLGIRERRRAARGVPVSKYLCDAARQCIERAGIHPEQIDRIVYCRLFGDHSVPATSLRVLQRLGVRRGIPAMDISAACSGVLHAIDVAISAINAGDDYVLVLGGDISVGRPEARREVDTRTAFLNGDGFAAVLLGPSDRPHFKCRYFYTDSDLYELASIPFGSVIANGSMDFSPDVLNLAMPDGRKIHKSVLESCAILSRRLLELAGMTMANIDFFITSDQTRLVWQDQVKMLGLSESQSVSCFHKYGNTVAAMVPLNLNEAIETGKLKRGMTVMMMGHGAGASGGGFIFTY